MDLLGGRPLEELGAVDAVLVVDLVGGEQALLDPAVDALLRGIQQPRRLAYRELLHRAPAPSAARSIPDMSARFNFETAGSRLG